MNILDHIISSKRKEVALKKQLIPISQLEQSVLFERETVSLSQRLKNSPSGIIAEHKRRSPSKSVINQSLNVQDVVLGYEKAGACGVSVLTDGKYFGGSLDDLLLARASTTIPLLRKEFIINEYQIVEAKAYGADAILLIAAVLSREAIASLSKTAQQLGLEVLLEVHNQEELNKSLMPSLDLLGVNNRDLKTFNVSLNTSKSLSTLIPDEFVKVSESGISDVVAIKDLKTYGYQGFLIGETFMKTPNPEQSAAQFIKQLV
ncbi:MAG: indole-3-glycerol phosphate synthase TrpC [Algicola sp.]|nr:indole-3-glycerol phosphate synthase TrpC [Algicola sp.]